MCTIEQHPGKFEGQSCITQLAYDWAQSGYGYDEYEELSNLPTTIFHGPFTLDEIEYADIPVCAECVTDILSASRIAFWEDNYGFAYSALE